MVETTETTETEPGVSVRKLIEGGGDYLGLELLAGADGIDRTITHQRIQKPGLAMAGHTSFIHPGRVQCFGESEITCLRDMDSSARRAVLEAICDFPLTCIAVTKGLPIPEELSQLCEQRSIPLLRSPLLSSTFIDRLNHFLDAHFAPMTTVHGVLMDIIGVGVLLRGPSSIGKSECALDLVMRGHRLVSDDVVEIQCRQGEILVGRAPELVRHHMEVRGLGIINIAHLFGIASTRHRKRVELVIDLAPGDLRADCDRLGLDEDNVEILGVSIPRIGVPVVPGRSLANLIEVAARNLLLKLKGLDPAADLEARLQAAIRERGKLHPYDLDEGDLE